MPDKHATLEEVDGRPALRFERTLPHPRERVWRALTDTQEMFAWHPTPAEFEPRVGGRVAWHPDGHVADMPENEVTDWDPPRLLGYTRRGGDAAADPRLKDGGRLQRRTG